MSDGAEKTHQPYAIVLGTAQDGGYPHTGCERPCCARAWADPDLRRLVACLGIVDPQTDERWMIDATPDFAKQLHRLQQIADPNLEDPGQARPPVRLHDCPASHLPDMQARSQLSGILLTHAHIGHYLGLAQLGRESMHTRHLPVYVMPRMGRFLRESGPWCQLISLGNIELRELQPDQPVRINDRISVTPIPVPHRGEFSETVGFRVQGPTASLLYIPDIDSWSTWDTRIEDAVRENDIALLDGTFYNQDESPGRDLSTISHPLIVDTLRRLSTLPEIEKTKVEFIHLNHTNEALRPDSNAAAEIRRAGFGISRDGAVISI